MSHDKPTAIPYPCFETAPTTSIASVGRCRLHTTNSVEFQQLVSKNIERAEAESKEKTPEQKKLCKKLMKQSVAECSKWLSTMADVSVIDVEVCVRGKDVLETDGFIVQCLMDAGADTVVLSNDGVSDEEFVKLLDTAKVPSERICAHFDKVNDFLDFTMKESVTELVNSISFFCECNEGVVSSLKNTISENKTLFDTLRVVAMFESLDGLSMDNITSNVSSLSKSNVDIAMNNPSSEQLGLSYAACVKTDRLDGLYTTVVCTRSGEALGLVYSSNESIVAALECGRGVYYSRSRKGLWRKGDTSGHFQVLHRIDLDCDGDAIRFTVTQRGDEPAFCHLNTLTCWGKPRGMRHLEETLVDRMKSAPEGSYTKRLFDDAELLRNKLVEEAQELAEADDHQHVAEELADVLYFAMVRAAKIGVSLDDAAAELDKRARKVTRRQGDSKAFRIAAGDAILKPK